MREGAPVPFAAALFDLDGTLVDREPLLTAAVVEVMAGTGVEVVEARAAGWVGRSWCDVHAELAADGLAWPFERWHGAVLGAAERLARDGFSVRELAGGAALVHALAGNGSSVALVTGSTRREVAPALVALGLAERFRALVTAEDVARGKPDPAPFLLGARRLGVAPGRCVAFEDSEAGIASARAAGMAVVATAEANAAPGAPGRQDLSGADVVVASLAEVDDDVLARAARARRARGGTGEEAT